MQQLRANAGDWIHQDSRILALLRNATQKIEQQRERLSIILDDLRIMVKLISYWARREYTDIPWNSLLAIVGALVYFVNPMDLVPDFIHGLGLLDDASIIAMVIAATHKDLDRFRVWYQRRASDVGADGYAR